MNNKMLSLPVSQGEGYVISAGEKLNKAVLVEESGTWYAVNPNAIITINCTVACNAQCFFCYNKLTFMRGNSFVSADHPSLHRAIRFARKAGIWKAALSGGEPTLDPQRLLALAELLSQAGFSQIRLHTNGLRLAETVQWKNEEGPLYSLLKKAGVTDISISVADYRPDHNEDIMGIDNTCVLADVLPELVRSGLETRLSCYLCGHGINSAEAARAYLRWGASLGVRQFIFRVSPDGNNGHVVLMESIKNALTQDGYITEYSHQKSDSIIYELVCPDCHVSLSCASEETDPDQKIRRLIYMPNNVVYTSWIDPSSYLFEADQDGIISHALGAAALLSRMGMSETECAKPVTIDLHVHSRVSDGLLNPTEVVRKAVTAGIKQLVFTEHNCLHSSPVQLAAETERLGVELPFWGIEFSTVYTFQGKPLLKFHMLIYGQRPEQFDFRRSLFDPNTARNAHIRRLYQRAYESNAVNRSLEEIYFIDDPAAPTEQFMYTRTPLAQAIAETCNCTVEEAKAQWLPPMPEEQRYRDYIDCLALLKAAHASGCVAILAHPGWIRPFDEHCDAGEDGLFHAIADLARQGLDGIEVFHRQNTPVMRGKLLALADAFDLIVTGGSDFHGKPRCVLGIDGTQATQFRRLMTRIGVKAQT